jgi:hypothetical protein
VAWDKPFVLKLLDAEVNVLTTPPKQVLCILRAHARRHLDRQLLGRLCKEYDWDEVAVMRRYEHGIDWKLLRSFLNDAALTTPHERKALAIVAAGGFWPEARRHAKGLRCSPLCSACGVEEATDGHRIHDCLAMSFDQYTAEAHGHLPKAPAELREAAWAPLAIMGLPPKPTKWTPAEIDFEEGHVSMDSDIYIYIYIYIYLWGWVWI